jgi:hypothetical protein
LGLGFVSFEVARRKIGVSQQILTARVMALNRGNGEGYSDQVRRCVYHVMARGNRREPIFRDNPDSLDGAADTEHGRARQWKPAVVRSAAALSRLTEAGFDQSELRMQ